MTTELEALVLGAELLGRMDVDSDSAAGFLGGVLGEERHRLLEEQGSSSTERTALRTPGRT